MNSASAVDCAKISCFLDDHGNIVDPRLKQNSEVFFSVINESTPITNSEVFFHVINESTPITNSEVFFPIINESTPITIRETMQS